MKKLVVIALMASFATTAFAQKHMIQFFGWDSGDRSNSFDLSTRSNDETDEKRTDIALNYAYAITDSFQLGATYKSVTGETIMDDGTGAGTVELIDIGATTYGLDLFWNLDNQLVDTHVIGLRYHLTDYSEDGTDIGGFFGAKDDKRNDITLEYSYRWQVGSAWGLNLTYAPRVGYTISKLERDAAGQSDETVSSLEWDFLKFDLLF